MRRLEAALQQSSAEIHRRHDALTQAGTERPARRTAMPGRSGCPRRRRSGRVCARSRAPCAGRPSRSRESTLTSGSTVPVDDVRRTGRQPFPRSRLDERPRRHGGRGQLAEPRRGCSSAPRRRSSRRRRTGCAGWRRWRASWKPRARSGRRREADERAHRHRPDRSPPRRNTHPRRVGRGFVAHARSAPWRCPRCRPVSPVRYRRESRRRLAAPEPGADPDEDAVELERARSRRRSPISCRAAASWRVPSCASSSPG